MTNRGDDGYLEICTIGTSTRTLEDFLLLLREVGVAVVVDVRRFPTSRLEHFRGRNLEQELKSIGIRYVYLGGGLGGYREGGYEAYVATEEFRLGVEVVERIAERDKTAILCAERLPWKCHRRFIAAELQRRGWRVTHIIDAGRNWVPRSG